MTVRSPVRDIVRDVVRDVVAGESGAAFAVVLTGLTAGEARIGDHASIGYTINPDNGTETVKWSNSSNPADAATYGTGASPTDYTAGDGTPLYLHVTDNAETVTRSAPIRYAPGTAPNVADQSAWTVDDTAVNLDGSASGANLTFGYVLSGEASGISINPSTGLITGTPDTVESGTATITATDQYGRTLQDTFTWSAALRTQATAANGIGAQNWTVDDDTVNLNTVSDFTTNGNSLTYVITGLPAGLSDDGDGSISGTPTVNGQSGTITVTATDEYARDTVSTFTYSTAYRTQAVGGADLDLSFVEDSAITPTDLIQNWTVSGNTLTTVGISPSLPSGLSVDSSGTLSGTPTDATADAQYTLTMADEYGRQTADTFNLEITAAGAGATLAFAAGASTQLIDGTGTFEFNVQERGTGTPTVSMDAGTLIKRENGLYGEAELNGIPAYGARRVRNDVANSEDMTTSSFITGSSGVVLTATTVDLSAGNFSYVAAGGTPDPGSDSIPAGTQTITLTTTPQRFSLIGTSSAGRDIRGSVTGSVAAGADTAELRFAVLNTPTRSFCLQVRKGSGGSGFYTLTDWQVEDVSGQANQNPGEYVPTSGAPATKYFSNANGNTVASNVVTEADGPPLAEQPGLLSQQALTNLQIRSNDLTNSAWSKANVSVALDAVGLTGAPNTASTITVNGSGGSRRLTENIFFTAGGSQVVSVWAKAGTQSWLMIEQIDYDDSNNQSANAAWFDVLNGVVGTVGSNITGTDIEDAGNGFYRCLFEFETVLDLSGLYRIFMCNGDGSNAANDGETLVFGNAEVYSNVTIAAVKGTTPIFTEGATVSQAAVTNSYDDANHDDTEGLWFFEFQPFEDLQANSELLSLSGAADLASYDATGNAVESTDGTNTATRAQALAGGTYYPVSVAYGSGNLRVRVNGNWGTAQSYDGAFPSGSAIDFLRAWQQAGTIRNVRRYDATYAEAQTQAEALDP